MTTPHDPRKPHPRTVLWMTKQQAKCKECANVVDLTGMQRDGSGGMRCKASPPTLRTGPRVHAYCIDAREPGQPCGPKAALFVPKKGKS